MFSACQWLQWFQRRPVAVKIVDVLDEGWFGIIGQEKADSRKETDNPASLRERYQREIEQVVAILLEEGGQNVDSGCC